MLQNKLEKQSHSIVLLGDFTPSILQPDWFEKYNLLGPLESKEANSSKEANIEIINKDVSIFAINWFNLQVLRDRFIAKSDQPSYFEFLFDLVVNTFTILKHTPLKKIGINFDCHYQFHDKKAYNHFVKSIYNKESLNEIGDCEFVGFIVKTAIKKIPNKGFTRIRIEKSAVYPEDGIFIEINDHFDGDENNKDSFEIIKHLITNWKKSIQTSQRYVEKIVSI